MRIVRGKKCRIIREKEKTNEKTSQKEEKAKRHDGTSRL